MKLENKNVVVTGGAGGIGAAMCRLFAQQGANVLVSDLNLEAAGVVASEIGGFAVQCDVSNESAVQSLVKQAEDNFGHIDLFCSNAGFGVGEPSHAASASNDVWQKNWDVHVMAHVYASRALLPKMIERGSGYLMSTASAAGLLSQIGDAAYTVTKHAAVAFAESLAITHGDDGIKVSVLCPQYVNTNILMISDEQRAKPMPGVLSAEECAQCVLEAIENEVFLITPHPEVRDYMMHRASDPDRWIGGMRRYRKTLVDEDGKMNFAKIFDK
ncbi:MAG: SDR family NAD(P)-dependent oxidoreductase [Arenicella sp.]|jgi:NAD(P)-dependent dehydrogenase (short-subunit alcohol dehydrogenase family)|nr:SDR family NAD(P)-dependent oxidoreductase [Arenicella sp.]